MGYIEGEAFAFSSFCFDGDEAAASFSAFSTLLSAAFSLALAASSILEAASFLAILAFLSSSFFLEASVSSFFALFSLSALASWAFLTFKFKLKRSYL